MSNDKVEATFFGAVDTAAIRRDYRQASRLDILALCDEVERLTTERDMQARINVAAIEKLMTLSSRQKATLDRVRALADEWSRAEGSTTTYVAIGAGLGQFLDETEARAGQGM